MNLLPPSAHDYDDFRKSIKKYNYWFIQLRYFAAVSVMLFLIGLIYFFHYDLTSVQQAVIFAVSLVILFYNLLLAKSLRRSEPSSLLYFSLIQISLDLFTLSILVYFTGGIEAPIFMFFIFHMILGSLLLPRTVIYSIASMLFVSFSFFSAMEFTGIIPHQSIGGFLRTPFYNDANFVIGILAIFGIVIFISIMLTSKIAEELYGRERQLIKALDDLNEAEKAKQQYVLAIVHELKSPLAAASSFLELIIKEYFGKINNDISDKLDRVKQRLTESITSINNIIHISRFRLLHNVNKMPVKPDSILNKIIDEVKPSAENKGIKITVKDQRTEKREINADQVLLQLTFSNLITNAIKYTGADGTIEITLNEDQSHINFQIADNGIGIPVKELNKIFDDFYRASNSRNKAFEGTGVGLSVVKQIVESHGGRISVYSPSALGTKINPGTSFEIQLPVE